MKKLLSLSIKNRPENKLNTKKSKKRNQSKLIKSKKLKQYKNNAKQSSKRKTQQKGNAQLINHLPEQLLSIFQSKDFATKLKELDEQSCLTQIKFGFNYLKDFLTDKFSNELDNTIDTLFKNNQIIKKYGEEKIKIFESKIEILQDKFEQSNMVKIIFLAIIIGNLALFFLDNREQNITLEDTQLPSKILFIIQTLVNTYLLSSNSASRSEFLKKNKYYLKFSNLSMLQTVLGFFDSSITYTTSPQSINTVSIQQILEYEPIQKYNIHNILLLGLTIIIFLISYIITKKIIIPIFDEIPNYNLLVEDQLVGLSENTINDCCLSGDETKLVLPKRDDEYKEKLIDSLCDKIKLKKQEVNLVYNEQTCENLKNLLKGDKMKKCE